MIIFIFSFHILYFLFFFCFNDTATTEIDTLSLHDALPIYVEADHRRRLAVRVSLLSGRRVRLRHRSEEHTSELQSQSNRVCRLLLEKQKIKSEGPNHVRRKIAGLSGFSESGSR